MFKHIFMVNVKMIGAIRKIFFYSFKTNIYIF